MKATADLQGDLYCEQQVRMALLWKDIKGVENKSISSSIKKFSRYSREEMEKMSGNVSIPYLVAVINSKAAARILTNIRSGDYHIVPEYIRAIPIPFADVKQQHEIEDKVLQIIKLKKDFQDTRSIEDELDNIIEALYTGRA